MKEMSQAELQDLIDTAALIFDYSKIGGENGPKLNRPSRDALERVKKKSEDVAGQKNIWCLLKKG